MTVAFLTLWSRFVKGPTIAFIDQENDVWRMMRTPTLHQQDPSAEDRFHLPMETTNTSSNMSVKTPKTKAARKQKNVSRPPNAFILYRQHWHPKIKAQLGDKYHNNDVSVIIGDQWNKESKEIKTRWKTEAERRKVKHYMDHPNYVYAPRKPGEKKRRMTAKKAGAMVEAPKAQTTTTNPAAAPPGTFSAVSATSNNFTTLENGYTKVTMPTEAVVLMNNIAAYNAGLRHGFASSFDPSLQDSVVRSTAAAAAPDGEDGEDSNHHTPPLSLSMFDFDKFAQDYEFFGEAATKDKEQARENVFQSGVTPLTDGEYDELESQVRQIQDEE